MVVNLLSWSPNHDTTTGELGSVPIVEGASLETKAVGAADYRPSVVSPSPGKKLSIPKYIVLASVHTMAMSK
jgi:hypothetical protein